jgi:GDPmannose 4,6-dehydratase
VESKIALITGITWQDGSYLAELLLSKGYEVHGIKRRSSSFNTTRIDHLYQDPHEVGSKFHLHYGDLTDSTNIFRLIQMIRPDEIYNLAAQSHVAVSFESPEYTAKADALGPLRMLEAIRSLDLIGKTKFYQASTSEMYGGMTGVTPLDENSKFHPRSPYGVSKLFGHWITINYREAYNMFASTGILFNHESPRRGETFVTQKIVRAAVGIKLGREKTLYLGNLDATRDWGHAKDYVDGMWRILNYNEPSDWVLATESTCSVRKFCEKAFNLLDIEINWVGQGLNERGVSKDGQTLVQVDSKYYRPAEVSDLLGKADKARDLLGWEPKITLDDMLQEMVSNQFSQLG